MRDKICLFKVFMSSTASTLVAKTVDSGYIGQGPKVEEFEAKLKEVEGLAMPPLAINSGTAALDLAYHLVGIGPGSEVISTPVSCCATNIPLINRGARIIWADVNPETGLICPHSVKEKLEKWPKAKAIVTCDWGGHLCGYGTLKRLGLPIIQDGAHSFGAEPYSSHGDYRMWSFQAIKHVTCGDGGALLVPESQYKRAKLLRWYGLDRKGGFSFRCKQDIVEAGYKYAMNDIAATIGLANLMHAKELVDGRRRQAAKYQDLLKDCCAVKLPKKNWMSSWWLYTVLVDHQGVFIQHMDRHGIEASPVHSRNDTKKAMHFDSGPLPGVDSFAAHEVCIPIGPWLSKEDEDRIVNAVRDYDELRRL